MLLPSPNAITVMPFTPIIVSGITPVSMKSRMARRTPIRLKPVMPSCAITWLDWLVHPVVSRVVPVLSNVPYVCSSIVSTIASYISIVTLIMFSMSSIFSTHQFSHSPIMEFEYPFEFLIRISMQSDFRRKLVTLFYDRFDQSARANVLLIRSLVILTR